QRQLADALAGGSKDSIGEGRGGRWDTWLPDAADLVGIGECPNLDQRRLIKTHALEGMVVRLLGDPVRIRQLGIHRVAESPDDASLNLIIEVLGIQNSADLGSHEDFVDPDAARRIRDLDHLGGGHAEREREGDAAPAILAEITSPARHLANSLENLARGLVPAQPQPLLQRVRAGSVDQLIEEAVVQEAVAGRADRAPRADRHQFRHTIAGYTIVRNL